MDLLLEAESGMPAMADVEAYVPLPSRPLSFVCVGCRAWNLTSLLLTGRGLRSGPSSRRMRDAQDDDDEEEFEYGSGEEEEEYEELVSLTPRFPVLLSPLTVLSLRSPVDTGNRPDGPGHAIYLHAPLVCPSRGSDTGRHHPRQARGWCRRRCGRAGGRGRQGQGTGSPV